MADSVAKIRIDTQEVDTNIKRTSQALVEYFKKVKEAGGTLMYLDEGVMEAVQALGEFGTKAENTRGALRELTQATTDLTTVYRSLTDEERNSPLGQEMAKSIAQLTERAGAAKDAMCDVSAAIANAASDTRGFDQVAGAVSLMTSSFQTSVGAAKLLGIEIGNEKEVLTTLAAAMSITNGLQTAQNLLQQQSALMMGVHAAQATVATAAQTALAVATGSATIAQKAFNVVANLNPYVALATGIAAVGGALYAFVSASSEAKKKEEERQKAAEEAARAMEQQRQTMENAASQAFATAGMIGQLQQSYSEANSEIAKTQILQQAQQEFKKLGIECNSINDAQQLLTKEGGKLIEMIQLQGEAAAIGALRMEAYKKVLSELMSDGNLSLGEAATMANYNKEVKAYTRQLVNINSQMSAIKGSLPKATKAGGNSGRGHSQSTTAKEDDPMAENSKKINELTNEYIKATEDRRAAIQKEIAALQERNKEILKLKDIAQGKAFDGGQLAEVTVTASKSVSNDYQFKKAPTNFDSISTWASGIQEQLNSTNIGSALFDKLTEQLNDASRMSQVLQMALDGGVKGADLSEIAAEMKKNLLEGDISDEAWQKFFDKINEGIEDKDFKIEFDIDHKKITTASESMKKEAAETANSWKKTTGAINQLGSALQNIEDPGAKAAGTVIMAVASAAAGFAEASKGPFTSPWEWIAFVASGIATMITMISSIHSATKMASGGFVPGTSYSGDNIMANGGALHLDAGELVLNRAQQGALASQLDGGGFSNMELETRVSAEDIIFVLNNNGNRRGYGDFINE